jgi:hypothetical protein
MNFVNTTSQVSEELINAPAEEVRLLPVLAAGEYEARVRVSQTRRALINDADNFRTLKQRAGAEPAIYLEAPGEMGLFHLVTEQMLQSKAPRLYEYVQRAYNAPDPQDRFASNRPHLIAFFQTRERMLIGKEEREVYAVWVRKASSAASFIDLELDDNAIKRLAGKG